MGRRHLYLHETIDIVGQGQYDYMAHTGREPTNAMPDMLTLQGTFFVCAMGGGRWPQVINIWDVGEAGWQGWAANVDRLNLKRRAAFYGEWWDEAAQWRSGGFDRLCGGVPGSPSTAQIAERGVSGTLFVQQVLSVQPGSTLTYLDSVVDEQVPLWREYDHEPTGIYEVMGNQHEVVVVWATSISGQTRLRAARDAALGWEDEADPDERLLIWERHAAQYVTGGETQVMTPQPGTVYGPEDWDEASLDDWFHPGRGPSDG
jgi:hypothetical protein